MTAASVVSLVLSFIVFSAEAQKENATLTADELVKLIPNKFEDFYMNSDPQSKLIAIGTLRYSIAEKNFVASRKRSIKILLFDYREALIMYNQATRKFSTYTPITSDTLVFHSLAMTDCTGWESYNVRRNFSQIMLGVCDRFFLTIEGTNVELRELKKVIGAFKFDTFPKLIIDGPKSR
jgi:hypothetical protein